VRVKQWRDYVRNFVAFKVSENEVLLVYTYCNDSDSYCFYDGQEDDGDFYDFKCVCYRTRCFLSVNSCTSGLLNSGITDRTPNIFSVFLFDYIQQFHTNGLLTTQFRL
jgi:hypothetical protein